MNNKSKPKRTPKRPRLKNKDSYQGYGGYFITTATYYRRHSFAISDVTEHCINILKEESEKRNFLLHAYCFMPDHVHIVVEAKKCDCDLEMFVRVYKQKTGYWFKKHYSEQLWQHSYYDRVLRDQKELITRIRYTLLNPVKAHLVTSADKYPFSAAPAYSEEIYKGLKTYENEIFNQSDGKVEALQLQVGNTHV